jgi:hypothetical protein
MPKRKSIKGKGTDIFFEGDDKDEKKKTGKPANQPTRTPAYQPTSPAVGKATFYLPTDLIDELDEVWMNLRRKARAKKVAKSQIVTLALRETLEGWREDEYNEVLNVLAGQ